MGLSTFFRFRLSIAIAFSAIPGHLAVSHKFTYDTLFTFLGVLILSGAASGFNQILERKHDALMNRTRYRPLPDNRLTLSAALSLSSICTITGLAILYWLTTPTAALLGAFNLAWYICVYTPLKRKSYYAIFVGGVTGAVPPLIGATAANGSIISGVIFISIFLFFWQISHFLLLLQKYGKEYEQAGFQTIVSNVNIVQSNRLLFIFNLLTILTSFAFIPSKLLKEPLLITILVICSIWFIAYYYFTTKKGHHSAPRLSLAVMYLFQTAVLIILILSSVL